MKIMYRVGHEKFTSFNLLCAYVVSCSHTQNFQIKLLASQQNAPLSFQNDSLTISGHLSISYACLPYRHLIIVSKKERSRK